MSITSFFVWVQPTDLQSILACDSKLLTDIAIHTIPMLPIQQGSGNCGPPDVLIKQQPSGRPQVPCLFYTSYRLDKAHLLPAEGLDWRIIYNAYLVSKYNYSFWQHKIHLILPIGSQLHALLDITEYLLDDRSFINPPPSPHMHMQTSWNQVFPHPHYCI